MRRADPPRMAAWLLEHWTPGARNDALAGDLHEEFCAGRSGAWYWRQVMAAVAIACFREVANHGAVLLFAPLWSMLAPGWLLMVAAFEQHFNLNARFGHMEFPWSNLCDLGLLLGANLLFIWAGILVYLIPHLGFRRNLRLRPLAQGVLASIPVLIAVWAALIVLPKAFLHAKAADRSSLAPIAAYATTPAATATSTFALNPARISYERHGAARSAGKPMPDAGAEWRDGDESGNADNAISEARSAGTPMSKLALLVRLPFLVCVLGALWRATAPRRDCAAGMKA